MAHTHGGAKVGTKVANVVSRSIVATHHKLVGIKHKLAMAIFHSISDMISQEVHQSLDPVLVKLWEELPEDSQAKPLLNFVANEIGQLQAGAGISMVAGSLLGSLAIIINNELAPSIREILSLNPHLLPDPGTAAQLWAKGLADEDSGSHAIQEQGINSTWAKWMMEANLQYPDPTASLEMLRRGLIDVDKFIKWAGLNGIPVDVAISYADMAHTPLSPADAALAYLRGNIPYGQALSVATEWGILESDFQVMIDNTGEPLGLEQMLEAYRRGFISEDRLKQGILESRIRDDWIPTAVQLRYSPMSTAEAVNAVVQDQLDMTAAEQIADQNGLTPGAFQTLVNTAGSPLSRTEMEDLYNRGLVTQSQVEQALRESRLKNKYNSYAFDLHNRLLDTGQVSDAVLYGTLTVQEAIDKAMLHGYTSQDAAIIASSAVNRKLETERRQVVSAVVSLYEANGIDESDATSIASAMGFEPSQTAFILQAAEFRRNEKLVAAALSAIRSKYIGHHIAQSEVSAYIDALGLPTAQRDQVLQLWTIEREANVRMLTPAQVVKAFNTGLIDQTDATTRLTNLGYNSIDAGLLLEGA
jgi:hypothetical protein